MDDSIQAVRQIAKRLLDEKKVTEIIGYEKGTLPLRSTPCHIKDVQEVDKLIWDVTCENNLAKYLIDKDEKIGILAKGCDARSIVALIVENQIKRENVVVQNIANTAETKMVKTVCNITKGRLKTRNVQPASTKISLLFLNPSRINLKPILLPKFKFPEAHRLLCIFI